MHSIFTYSVYAFSLSKLAFSKKNFGNNIRVSNSLDPDRDQQSVDPDLRLNQAV